MLLKNFSTKLINYSLKISTSIFCLSKNVFLDGAKSQIIFTEETVPTNPLIDAFDQGLMLHCTAIGHVCFFILMFLFPLILVFVLSESNASIKNTRDQILGAFFTLKKDFFLLSTWGRILFVGFFWQIFYLAFPHKIYFKNSTTAVDALFVLYVIILFILSKLSLTYLVLFSLQAMWFLEGLIFTTLIHYSSSFKAIVHKLFARFSPSTDLNEFVACFWGNPNAEHTKKAGAILLTIGGYVCLDTANTEKCWRDSENQVSKLPFVDRLSAQERFELNHKVFKIRHAQTPWAVGVQKVSDFASHMSSYNGKK